MLRRRATARGNAGPHVGGRGLPCGGRDAGVASPRTLACADGAAFDPRAARAAAARWQMLVPTWVRCPGYGHVDSADCLGWVARSQRRDAAASCDSEAVHAGAHVGVR